VVCDARSLELADDDDVDDEDESTAAAAAECRDSSADDLTATDCHTHSIGSWSASARDTLTADSTQDVLAVPI